MRSIITKIVGFFFFLKTIYKQRFAIKQLVIREFQNKYAASLFGLSWAFIQPAVMIFVMWFAFSYGLRVGNIEGDIPFAIWLICGIVPWFFISETIQSSTNSLLEYSYLIKKTSVKTGSIPLIKLISAFIVHLFFICIIIIMVVVYGYYPDYYWIQLAYYMFCSTVLLAGIGWLTSSINVFVRDVSQAVTVVLSVMFWLTPIIWPYSMLTGNLKYIALLNPFFYITEGYRYVFLQKVWFFENIETTLFFWTVTLLIFVTGAFSFQKLKPHFADTL